MLYCWMSLSSAFATLFLMPYILAFVCIWHPSFGTVIPTSFNILMNMFFVHVRALQPAAARASPILFAANGH